MCLSNSVCLSCNKNDSLINKFDYCFQKRMKAPKNANNGHEHLGCVIFNSNGSYVLHYWFQPIWD